MSVVVVTTMTNRDDLMHDNNPYCSILAALNKDNFKYFNPRTMPISPNLTPEYMLTKHYLIFAVYLRFTPGLRIENVSSWGLRLVYSRFAFEALLIYLNVKQTRLLSYHVTACSSLPLFIPNT